jgi:tetratricopeptide (TPR) repeat protein
MLHVHARRARYDEARSCGEEARSAFERAGQPVLTGRAHNNLGILERMRDRPREAITHFARAAALLANEPPLLAHVENNLAEALLDLDRFAEAEGAFGRALTAFRSAGAHRHAGIVLGNLADLASRQGRLHEALVHFEEARRTLGPAAAPGDAARLAVEQADVLMSLGLVSAAASGYEDAVATLDAHAMEAEAARGRLGLGRALARLNDPRANATLARAAAAFAGKGNTTGHARTLAAQAEIAVGEGDLDEAARILDEARTATHDRPALEAWVDLLRTKVLSASDAARAEALAADRTHEPRRWGSRRSRRTLHGRGGGSCGRWGVARTRSHRSVMRS